jgi:ATP-dependent RNA helicase DeaD
LQTIERATRQPIAEMQLPSVEAVNDKRISKFKQRIGDTLAAGDLGLFQQMIEQYEQEHNVPALEIAAALARLVQGKTPLLLKAPERSERPRRDDERPQRDSRGEQAGRFERADRGERTKPSRFEHGERKTHRDRDDASAAPARRKPEPAALERQEKTERSRGTDAPASHRPRDDRKPETGFETFRIEVGHDHGVKPGNIVGAIANEAGLDSKHIGRVDIRDDHSFVDLPEGMPSDVFKLLKKVWVSGQQLRITRGAGDEAPRTKRHFGPRRAEPAGFERPRKPKPPARKR